MTLDENYNLKDNKKDMVSNSKNDDSNNLILEDYDEKLYEEAQYLSNALNDGNLNLTSEEESKLKKDLDLILSNIENHDQKYNMDEMVESEHINSNKFKDLNFGASILANNSKGDSSSSSFLDDGSVVENMDVVSVDDSNDSIFKKTIGSQDLDDVGVTDSVVEVDDSLLESGVGSQDLDDVGVTDSVVEVDDSLLESGVGSQDLDDDSGESISVDDALNDLIDDYSNDVVIKVNNVSMEYKLSQDKIDTFKEFFIRTIKRNKGKTKTINALKNISFEIPKGDRVGIIGFNGAGKSTLLKLLSRVYEPTEGTIETKGKIAPLLELGAGFDQNYTGKANIFLNGAFLGYSEDFIKEKYDEIVEFSELGDAINYHVKTYSSGMRAKLGFSIATIVEPDILIIDEILSVGDIKFRRKSSDKIRSLINSGITVLLVSHSVGQIRELCNKAIWIDDGKIKMMGEVNKVCDAYVKAADEASNEQLKNIELN